MRFRFWIACPAAPFQRLSIAANAIARPVRSSTATWIRHRFEARTSRTPGGDPTPSTKASSRTARRVPRLLPGAPPLGAAAVHPAHPPALALAGGRDEAAGHQPLVE